VGAFRERRAVEVDETRADAPDVVGLSTFEIGFVDGNEHPGPGLVEADQRLPLLNEQLSFCRGQIAD
jgi:hypothetical protein